jgi:hypothetical protein
MTRLKMYNNFFLFLLEEEELRAYFEEWPEKMLVAVTADADRGFSLVIYRQEEQGSVFSNLANSKNIELSDLHIIPKISGHPSLNIMFRQEQEIVNMVRENPSLLDMANDYSINYQYALDEGLTNQQLLPELSDDSEVIDNDTSKADSTSIVDEVITEEVITEEVTTEEITPPAKPSTEEIRIISGPENIVEKPSSETDAENSDNQLEVNNDGSSESIAKLPTLQDGTEALDEVDDSVIKYKTKNEFISPEDASNIKQISAFIRNMGHKFDVSPTGSDDLKIKGPLQPVLIKVDLSSFLMSNQNNVEDLFESGFSVDADELPEALKAKLSDNDNWAPITLTTHSMGILVSPGQREVENNIVANQVSAETTALEPSSRHPSIVRRCVEYAAVMAASVALMTAISPILSGQNIYSSKPSEITIDMENQYMDILRDRIFSAKAN